MDSVPGGIKSHINKQAKTLLSKSMAANSLEEREMFFNIVVQFSSFKEHLAIAWNIGLFFILGIPSLSLDKITLLNARTLLAFELSLKAVGNNR